MKLRTGVWLYSLLMLVASPVPGSQEKSQLKDLLKNMSISFGYGHPLADSATAAGIGTGSEGVRAPNQAFTTTFKWNIQSYWSASVTFFHYFRPELQKPWNPDFTYVIGYDDWHPGTFSFVYSNYGGNRLFPKSGQSWTSLEEGGLSIGYKIAVPRWFQNMFIIHESGALSASVGIGLVPRYTDLASNSKKEWKKKVGLTVKYTIYKWWYWNITFFYYPDPSEQQPWDPDFTYGFGYFDWHPGTVSIQYNNYSGNRFPWREKNSGTGEFENGSISLRWSWSF